MKGIRNIIFDFDGTLVDTAPLIICTMQATVHALGYPQRSEAVYKSTIGLRLEDVPSMLWPDIDGISETFAATYRRTFDRIKRDFEVKCFPGVYDGLRAFHDAGYRMAIASSRSRRSLEEYVGHFGLSDCFDMLVGGNDVKHGKPAPDPVLTILDSQKWKATETLTVGDAPVDILMGRVAGTWTCAVAYGNSSYDELLAAGPDIIYSSFYPLMEFLSGSKTSVE